MSMAEHVAFMLFVLLCFIWSDADAEEFKIRSGGQYDFTQVQTTEISSYSISFFCLFEIG